MKAPKIRFKGFEGDWDIKNLWNNSKISTWTCVTDKETSDNYKYPVISGWKDIMWYYFEYNRKPNTITIARAWTAWFVQLIKSPFYLNDKCFSVISNNEIFNTNFLFFSLKNSEKNIMNLRSSTSVPTINTQHLNSLQISLPSLPEQEKIWALFEQLDSHISKNQQKLEKLKNMKLSFLQKLFPKEWSVLPELRFKGFEGAWEEKKLGESLMSIQTWTNLLWWNDEKWTPLLKMWNIQRWFFDLSKLEYIAPQLQVEQENIAYYWDFFFNTRNTLELVGKWATRMWENGKFAFNSNIARFKLKNINTIFFNYLYNTNEIKKQISARAMWTTSVAAIYPTNLYTVEYKSPSLPEQEKIWAFFEKLDTQITQQTQKIQKLQNLKQSLLEKMFI